jgi:hypothetical protein
VRRSIQEFSEDSSIVTFYQERRRLHIFKGRPFDNRSITARRSRLGSGYRRTRGSAVEPFAVLL